MIIGLHGEYRSGKDTACEFIREAHSPVGRVLRRAFADPLKISAARALGFDGNRDECVEFCNKLKEQGYVDTVVDVGEGRHITGRQFLQRYGTEAHRDVFGSDFWVDASLPPWDGLANVERVLFGTDPDRDLVVFTDVRFPNEAERIREHNGVIWEIQRGERNSDTHASEQRLPAHLIDTTIYNTGTLEQFQQVIHDAVHVWNALHNIEVG